MRIAYTVILGLIINGLLVLGRGTDFNDSKSERRRHPSRLRGNFNAKIVEETVGK